VNNVHLQFIKHVKKMLFLNLIVVNIIGFVLYFYYFNINNNYSLPRKSVKIAESIDIKKSKEEQPEKSKVYVILFYY
jgi:hypothetical protein